MTCAPIQRPKILHAKLSEAQIARLSSALGKRGPDEPSGCYNSTVRGCYLWREVTGKSKKSITLLECSWNLRAGVRTSRVCSVW